MNFLSLYNAKYIINWDQTKVIFDILKIVLKQVDIITWKMSVLKENTIYIISVTCGPGTMYNAKTLSCDLCPIGQYQEKYKQSSCDSCPNGEITRSEGSTNLTDCKGLFELYFHFFFQYIVRCVVYGNIFEVHKSF